MFGKIEWEHDGNDIMIIYDDGKVTKTINDSLVTSSNELAKAESSFFAAQYVVNQPFALFYKNAELTLNGKVQVEGREAYVISVIYDGDTENSNKWSYYI